MEKVYEEERIPLVQRLLEERPWCERCLTIVDAFNAAPELGNAPILRKSRVIHEKRLRSAGGSITDEENCVALCEECHTHIHAYPKESREQGWLESRFSQ